MQEEFPFVADQRPWERAFVVVAGTPELSHDPSTEVVLGPSLGSRQAARHPEMGRRPARVYARRPAHPLPDPDSALEWQQRARSGAADRTPARPERALGIRGQGMTLTSNVRRGQARQGANRAAQDARPTPQATSSVRRARPTATRSPSPDRDAGHGVPASSSWRDRPENDPVALFQDMTLPAFPRFR